jgi:hypothetical protein
VRAFVCGCWGTEPVPAEEAKGSPDAARATTQGVLPPKLGGSECGEWLKNQMRIPQKLGSWDSIPHSKIGLHIQCG